MKLYVAGKNLERSRQVMDALSAAGHQIIYDWVALIDEGSTKEKAMLEAEAVRNSDALVYLWESDQESARYEAGMAMGLGKPVIVSGYADAFFFQLPNVHIVADDSAIAGKLNELESSAQEKNLGGEMVPGTF